MSILSDRGPRQGLAQLRPVERIQAVAKYARQRLNQGLLSLTFEVTKRCNARCDFCDHWREPKQPEGVDYVDVVLRLDPIVVIFCGGEPLLRRDAVEMVREVAAVPGWRYHVLITNGWLLTAELGLELHRAGLHQINVSLNWPDERQSEERRLEGLYGRIERTVPALTRMGVEVNLNTMIMRDNLQEVPRIARLALQWGAKVTYTLYSEHCNGNETHRIPREQAPGLARIVDDLIALKRTHRHITNNTYYLRECVEFIAGKRIPGCLAGQKMVHITPQGMVKPCADLAPICHYTELDHRAFGGVDCDICWMACRGEVQAPVSLERLREVVGW